MSSNLQPTEVTHKVRIAADEIARLERQLVGAGIGLFGAAREEAIAEVERELTFYREGGDLVEDSAVVIVNEDGKSRVLTISHFTNNQIDVASIVESGRTTLKASTILDKVSLTGSVDVVATDPEMAKQIREAVVSRLKNNLTHEEALSLLEAKDMFESCLLSDGRLSSRDRQAIAQSLAPEGKVVRTMTHAIETSKELDVLIAHTKDEALKTRYKDYQQYLFANGDMDNEYAMRVLQDKAGANTVIVNRETGARIQTTQISSQGGKVRLACIAEAQQVIAENDINNTVRMVDSPEITQALNETISVILKGEFTEKEARLLDNVRKSIEQYATSETLSEEGHKKIMQAINAAKKEGALER